MPLIHLLILLFLIKGLLLWPFYYKHQLKPLLSGFVSVLIFTPIMVILYHETEFNFWLVYTGMIVVDAVLYCILMQNKWWKAGLVSLLLNTIGMLLFFISEG